MSCRPALAHPPAAAAVAATNGSRHELPALRVGSARSVLLSVLGELVQPHDEPVWTSSLLYVLTGMGYEERTARQAVERAATAGWMHGSRHGRNVRWTLGPAGRQLIGEGAQRVHSLGQPQSPWNGSWLLLLVTLPGNRRTLRKRLYAALSWVGFGNPVPGLWLTPHTERAREAERIVGDLGLSDTTFAFVGPSASIGLADRAIVERAWNLAEVAANYDAVLKQFARRRPARGDELLFAHLELVNQWQRFPFMDPQLPAELLPDWIGRKASAVFERRRGEWTDRAQRRWREVVEITAPPDR